MTVIAFDGRTVAADKLANIGGVIRTVTKLYRADDGAVLAFAGEASHGLALVAWYNSGRKPADLPKPENDREGAFLHVFKAGQRPCSFEQSPIPIVFEDTFFAAGCGKAAAMGALYAGADARRAVQIANTIHTDCGGGVDVMELSSDTNRAARPQPEAARAEAAG